MSAQSKDSLTLIPSSRDSSYCQTLEPVVERFPIYFLQTEDSERVGLRGSFDFVVHSLSIGIARCNETECLILWPISVIRQYRLSCSADTTSLNGKSSCDTNGSKSRVTNFYRGRSSSASTPSSSSSNSSSKNSSKRTCIITIEVGRRCTTGEGIFKFSTNNGPQIIREIKKMVVNLANKNSSDKMEAIGRRRTNSNNMNSHSRAPSSIGIGKSTFMDPLFPTFKPILSMSTSPSTSRTASGEPIQIVSKDNKSCSVSSSPPSRNCMSSLFNALTSAMSKYRKKIKRGSNNVSSAKQTNTNNTFDRACNPYSQPGSADSYILINDTKGIYHNTDLNSNSHSNVNRVDEAPYLELLSS